MKRYSKIVILLGVVFSILSCNQQATEQKSLQNLNIGYLPIAVGLPLFVATDEGYFEEQGFEATLTRFASSNEVANAATSGQVDVSIAATNVMFDVGYVSKKKHTLIITNPYANQENHITDYILVADTSSIKKLSDLKNKKIGIFPGSVVKVFCHLILEKQGLTKDDYQLIELSPKDWAAALQSKQIDALSAVEPQASQILSDGIGYSISEGFYAQLMPNVPLSAQWISADFVKKNGKEKAEKIIAAIDKAVSFIENNPEKAKEYLAKYANVREDILPNVELNPWVSHSQINTKEIQNFIDILYENGAIQNREDINDYLLK